MSDVLAAEIGPEQESPIKIRDRFKSDEPLPKDAEDVALESYIYLYPLVLTDVKRKIYTFDLPEDKKIAGMAPHNKFGYVRSFSTIEDKVGARGNQDTLYCSGWLDLTKGPVSLTLPDLEDGRFVLMPTVDLWSETFASPSNRTTGLKGDTWTYVGPFHTSDAPNQLKCATNYAMIIGRVESFGPEDFARANAIQDQIILQGPESPPQKYLLDPRRDSKLLVEEMSAETFFNYAMHAMVLNPPHEIDYPTLHRMARIGLNIGKRVGFAGRHSDLLKKAAAEGHEIVSKLPVGGPVNGWKLVTSGVGAYGADYRLRAACAYNGWGYNLAEDAIYPGAFHDVNGDRLTGTKQYQIRFPEEPPVNAFWSVTLYDDGGFYVPNELNRYTVGSHLKPKKAGDGSITVYIQSENPGGELVNNWLPCPASETFDLIIRLYWPKPEALLGKWTPPALEPVTHRRGPFR